jgi:hypothetical protein
MRGRFGGWKVFGLIVEGEGADAVIVEAAPIAAWTVGRNARWVWDYFVDRRATVTWHPVDRRHVV